MLGKIALVQNASEIKWKGPLLRCQSVGNTGQSSSQFSTCTTGVTLPSFNPHVPTTNLCWGVKLHLQKNNWDNGEHQTFLSLTQVPLVERIMLNRNVLGHEALHWDMCCHKVHLLLHALNPDKCPRSSAPPEVKTCNDEQGLWFVWEEIFFNKEKQEGRKQHRVVNRDSRVEGFTVFITLKTSSCILTFTDSEYVVCIALYRHVFLPWLKESCYRCPVGWLQFNVRWDHLQLPHDSLKDKLV